MARLINLKLLADFFNKIDPKRSLSQALKNQSRSVGDLTHDIALAILCTSKVNKARVREKRYPLSGAERRVLHRSTANMCHSPGTPLRDWLPRSPKRSPEPATRSFTVLDTNTSPAPASAATRAPM